MKTSMNIEDIVCHLIWMIQPNCYCVYQNLQENTFPWKFHLKLSSTLSINWLKEGIYCLGASTPIEVSEYTQADFIIFLSLQFEIAHQKPGSQHLDPCSIFLKQWWKSAWIFADFNGGTCSQTYIPNIPNDTNQYSM